MEAEEVCLVAEWLVKHGSSVVIWCGALSTFAIYSVLYAENKFYRFFEHILIGLAAGFGVYFTWAQVLGPKWWSPMMNEGKWYLAFAAVLGGMFYFIHSRKHVWISRIVFGLFMGLAAGGMFREFYEIYFPQMGASMKPIAGAGVSAADTVNTAVFYVILLASMAYFFFSFEQKNAVVTRTAAAGRWFLMIGFGAIFGATVMGRMTLFVGRINFIINDWRPEVVSVWPSTIFRVVVAAAAAVAIVLIANTIRTRRSGSQT